MFLFVLILYYKILGELMWAYQTVNLAYNINWDKMRFEIENCINWFVTENWKLKVNKDIISLIKTEYNLLKLKLQLKLELPIKTT